jgi:multidrug efflux pump subunit AcrA (membrane-fusion protein)
MTRNRVKTVLMLALACLLVVGLSACGGSPQEVQSQLAEVSRGDLMVTVSADGNLSFVKDRQLTFGITGTIAEVNVEEGDWVSEGMVLARLDTASLELAAKAAEVDLEQATNQYQSLINPFPYITFKFILPESVDAIGIALVRIKEALEETQKGFSGGQYSMSEVRADLLSAQELLAGAENKLASGLGAGVPPNDVDYWTLRAAQLGMDAAQVVLDMANDDLEKAVMVAPFDGLIAAVNIKEGDSLSAMDYATRTIIELIDPAKMELSAEVDEIDIPDVKLGQRAIISVDALPDVQFEGEVTSVSPLATEESGLILYKIKVGFEAPEGSGLKAGMSATADIVISERSDVLLVPSRAIGEDSQGSPVVQVMVNGQIEERAVVIGITDGYDTEIISGLEEGEIVVVEKRASSSMGFMLSE